MRNWIEISGARILHVLMEQSGATVDELCAELGFGRQSRGPMLMDLINHLWMLADSDLIRLDGINQENTRAVLDDELGISRQKAQGLKIRASETWIKIQAALDGKLRGSSPSNYTTQIAPMFGVPTKLREQTDVFVVMPFSDAMRPIYDDHILPAISQSGLTVSRADSYLTTHPIMSDVWSGIFGAGVVVADCTGRNPNVFYELGVAHTLGRLVVLVAQNHDDVPTDLRHMRYIKYEYTPPGMKQFEQLLAKTITEALHVY